MNKIITLTLILFTFQLTNSQNPFLSSDSEISIITIGPGNSLNDSFGHSAFRVKTSQRDMVYNYGVYDFNTPNFYTKFAQGKLNYLLGINYYEDFENSYKRQDRTIKEQILNLSLVEKQKLYSYLKNNAKPKNKAYLYDFFYNNCATKIRDVTEIVLDNNLNYETPKDYNSESFRQLIRANLEWNSWGSFGIDLALGSVIDKENKPYDYMFLPEYIYEFFNNATLKSSGKKLVKETRTIYSKNSKKPSSNFFLSPFFYFSLISLLIIGLTALDYKRQTRSRYIDGCLFVLTGCIGLLIIFLWFGTDHTATAQNYNMLWAFPLNFLLLAQVLKRRPKKWFIAYVKLLVILLCLMTLHWFIGVQQFAPVLIPFLLAIIIRYLYLIYHFNRLNLN